MSNRDRPGPISVAALRLRRHVIALHGLGPRVLYELLAQVSRESGDPERIERIVAEFAAIDPAALRLVGGDRFPPVVFAVAGGDGER